MKEGKERRKQNDTRSKNIVRMFDLSAHSPSPCPPDTKRQQQDTGGVLFDSCCCLDLVRDPKKKYFIHQQTVCFVNPHRDRGSLGCAAIRCGTSLWYFQKSKAYLSYSHANRFADLFWDHCDRDHKKCVVGAKE